MKRFMSLKQRGEFYARGVVLGDRANDTTPTDAELKEIDRIAAAFVVGYLASDDDDTRVARRL